MLNRREFTRNFLAGGATLLTPNSIWPAGNAVVRRGQVFINAI